MFFTLKTTTTNQGYGAEEVIQDSENASMKNIEAFYRNGDTKSSALGPGSLRSHTPAKIPHFRSNRPTDKTPPGRGGVRTHLSPLGAGACADVTSDDYQLCPLPSPLHFTPASHLSSSSHVLNCVMNACLTTTEFLVIQRVFLWESHRTSQR